MPTRNFREFFKNDTFTLFATGDSNWDLYWMQYYDHPPVLVCLAKEGTGAADHFWGPVDHLGKLERQGIAHGFTIIK